MYMDMFICLPRFGHVQYGTVWCKKEVLLTHLFHPPSVHFVRFLLFLLYISGAFYVITTILNTLS